MDDDGYDDIITGGGVTFYLMNGPLYGTVDQGVTASAIVSGDPEAPSVEWNMTTTVGAGDLNGDGEMDFVAGGNCPTGSAVIYGPVLGEVDLAAQVVVGYPVSPTSQSCVAISPGRC